MNLVFLSLLTASFCLSVCFVFVFWVYLQPFLAVSVGQEIECRFLAHWPSFWQRMHHQSLYTVNDQDMFSCWDASASITALQYPASLFLIYAVTPPHFALASILCMKSKEACAHRWQKEGYTFQFLHECTYLLHISYSTHVAYGTFFFLIPDSSGAAWHVWFSKQIPSVNSIFALLKKKRKLCVFLLWTVHVWTGTRTTAVRWSEGEQTHGYGCCCFPASKLTY